MRLLYLITVLMLTPVVSDAQEFFNLALEKAGDEVVLDKWSVVESTKCIISLVPNVSHDGEKSLLLVRQKEGNGCTASLLNELKKVTLRDKKKIRISAYVRGAESSANVTILFRQLSSDGKDLLSTPTNTSERRAGGEWVQYTHEFDIERTAEFFAFGIKVDAIDSVWVDNFELFFDEKKLVDGKTDLLMPTEEDLNWLRANLVPIDMSRQTIDAGDFQYIKHKIADGAIVGLGEVTHGSSEIFIVKRKLLQFLLSEMEYKILALEMNMAEAEELDRYVIGESGNVRDILARLSYWTWRTEEFAQTLELIRDLNTGVHRKIRITGFDINYSDALVNSLATFAKKYDSPLMQLVDSISFSINQSLRTFDPSQSDQMIRQTDRALGCFTSNKLSAISPKDEFDRAFQILRILQQAVLYMFSSEKQPYFFRDKGMFDNLSWIIGRHPSDKIIVWAHNDHLSKAPMAFGDFLNQNHPYFSVAFALGAGKFNAKSSILDNEISVHNLKPPIADSYESFFSKSRHGSWFLDLGKAFNPWLSKTHKFRFVGAVATDLQFTETNLKEYYDALIYINTSTPTKLLSR